MKRVLSTLLASLAVSAHAQGTMLTGFVSKHASGTYCETNPGVGYQNEDGYAVLAYRNSLCRTSVAAVREFQVHRINQTDLVAGAGVATGYKWALSPVGYVAAVTPVSDRLAVAVGFVPGFRDLTTAAVWAQARYALSR